MKVSVIIPVKNETKSIRDLLDSLLSQSRKPDEIVITDGGSCDTTIEIINEYINKGAPIRLLREKEALPGRGRNIAISNAKNEIIAMTDAGVILDKDWLLNLILPFENGSNNIEVVYGIQRCYAKTLFEKCFSVVYMGSGYKSNGKKLLFPYLGAFAIKNYVWEKVGGFREDLRATEDILFFRKIKEFGFKAEIKPSAVAYWRPRASFKEALILSFKYSECDALSLIHTKTYIKKYLSYLIGVLLVYLSIKNPIYLLILLTGFFVSTLFTCKKHWKKFIEIVKESPRGYFIIALIILVLDIGNMSGFLTGILKKYFGRTKKCPA